MFVVVPTCRGDRLLRPRGAARKWEEAARHVFGTMTRSPDLTDAPRACQRPLAPRRFEMAGGLAVSLSSNAEKP